MMEVKKVSKVSVDKNVVYLISSVEELNSNFLSTEEMTFVRKEINEKKYQISINRLTHYVFIVLVEIETEKDLHLNYEKARISGGKLVNHLNQIKASEITISSQSHLLQAFIEGMMSANYQFLKYRSEKNKNTCQKMSVVGDYSKKELLETVHIVEALFEARNLVNEPVSYLDAVKLSEELIKIGKSVNLKVEVLGKKRIATLKMGGLLAVNQGSTIPPTFSIAEWKPKKVKNEKPIVLVGKGVVYDTGGLSLKPTANSMDFMKSDMGGAAAVIGALIAVAKNKLPIHVIGLIPATDNRPGGNAYAPGDVITMHNKKTVEILNTDAEGRMILADALSYAKKYDPELVIDLATLTGSAASAIGHYGIVAMGNAGEKLTHRLKESGNNVYERIVEFPFWDEYNEQLESNIADITNLGSGMGGAITAGKFLEHFTDYPYIHMDIAGPAFLKKSVNYIPQGGTGVGVRLLYDFIKNYK